MSPRKFWHILRDSFTFFMDGRAMKLSAALAYHTIFSLPGLIIIIIWITDLFWGQKAVEGTIYGQISSLVGSEAAAQIQETIRNATLSNDGQFATIVGIATLVWGSTQIFNEIQDSVNLIWQLKAKPRGRGILKFVLNRLLSFSMVVSLGFLMLVSLLINGLMDAFINQLTRAFPDTELVLVYAFNFILSFSVTAFLFGLIFKVLPDARIEWRHVRAGAIATAILFMLGKSLIGYYLGHSRMTSAYGAAGSVIVILLWVYFSAIILYFGAAFTRAYAIHKGAHIYPNQYAVWVDQVELESKDSLQRRPDAQKAEKE